MLALKRAIGGIHAVSTNEQRAQRVAATLRERVELANHQHLQAANHVADIQRTVNELRREKLALVADAQALRQALEAVQGECSQRETNLALAAEAARVVQSELAAAQGRAEGGATLLSRVWHSLVRDEVPGEAEQHGGTPVRASRSAGPRPASRGVAGGAAGAAGATHGREGASGPTSVLHRRGVVRARWRLAFRFALLTALQRRVVGYQQAFLAVQQATGIQSVEGLAGAVTQLREGNYQLFRATQWTQGVAAELAAQLATTRQRVQAVQVRTHASEEEARSSMQHMTVKTARAAKRLRWCVPRTAPAHLCLTRARARTFVRVLAGSATRARSSSRRRRR